MTLSTQDLRNMTKEELVLKIEALRQDIFHLTYEAKSGSVEKPHKIKDVRRDIARCKTILREMDIGKEQS